jgi:hypothetical protein
MFVNVCVWYAQIIITVAMVTLLRDFRPYGKLIMAVIYA